MTADPFDAGRNPEDDPHNRCGGFLSAAWLRAEAMDLEREEIEAADERQLPDWVRAGLMARRGLSECGRPC